jgi:hypothetical protein
VENSELASPDAAPSALDGAAMPDAGLAGADVPVATPDAPGLRADTSAGAETAGETSGPLTCVDKDGDGYGVGAGCRGPDCDDTNTNVWISCGTCQDADGDGYFVGCDRYTSPIMGPDCDDTAPFCTNSCIDADKNGTADCAEYWFGETSRDLAQEAPILVTKDGSFLIYTNTKLAGFGGLDFQLTKVNRQGRVLWQKLYGTSDDDYGVRAGLLPDDSVLVTGQCGPAWKPWFAQIGADGTVLRSKYIPLVNANERPDMGLVLPNGNLLAAGQLHSGPTQDLWIGELSGDLLSFVWQKRLSGGPGGTVYELARFPDGDLFAGNFVNTTSPRGLIKLSSTGDVRWARLGLYELLKVAIAPDGNMVFASFDTGKPLTLAKMTADGDVLWYKQSTGLGGQRANTSLAVRTDDLGNIFAAASSNWGVSGGNSSFPSWLVKVASDGQIAWTYSAGKYAPVDLQADADGSLTLTSQNALARLPADPSTSCALAPQPDTLKDAQASFTALTVTSTAMTPWVLADYPINTMPGAVTWKPICPAATP